MDRQLLARVGLINPLNWLYALLCRCGRIASFRIAVKVDYVRLFIFSSRRSRLART
jgi:hypothetical protein